MASLIVGCSSSGDGQDAPAPTFSPETTSATATDTPTDAPTVVDVDPADFERDGRTIFNFRTSASDSADMGLCVVAEDSAASDSASVTCNGTAPDDAPDIQVPAFERQRPGAATITAEGVTYNVLEGVPPAPGELQDGERLNVGDASCTLEDSELDCTVGETGLTISGDDRTMTITGDVLDSEYHVDPNEPETSETSVAPSEITEDYTETDEPVSAGTTCGAASGNTLVEVREGSVSCLTAEGVIDEYRERASSEGGGNTLAMKVGEWDCSIPSAGRSAELQAGEICNGPDDVVIATPPGSVPQ